jgi:hypothetical protein
MEQEEKRREKRHEVEGLKGFLTFCMDVKIVNVSLTGMAVETNRSLTVNHDYIIKLELDDERLDLKGRVMWSALGRTEKLPNGDVLPVYNTGITFLDVLDKKAMPLLRFIEDNRIVTLEKRILGRFRIGSDTAHIDYPQEFIIRKISLTGMLIETDFSLEKNEQINFIIRFEGMNEIALKGVVVSVLEPSVNSLHHELGIKFTSLQKKQRDDLKKYLKSLHGV